MIKTALRETTKTSLRSIGGFAEQTRQERCAKPEVSADTVRRLFSEREQFINFQGMKALQKYNMAAKQVHSNLLPSNFPTEDRRATCLSRNSSNSSLMCGVFDGHAGPHCAQLVSERLFYYLHFASLSDAEIERMLDLYYNQKPLPSNPNFFRTANDPSLSMSYANSKTFLRNLMNFGEKLIHDPEHSVNRTHQECIYLAAVQLDEDLHMEVLDPDCDQMMVQAAISGAVACFAHIIQNHLYVGNIGDSAAVLVQNDGNGRWRDKKMSSVHSGQNEREVQRINSEHPPNESRTVLRNQRLLGCLSPLRAFGDARFKLSHQELTFLEDRNFDFDNDGTPDKLVLPFYRTPPYLNSKPQIRYHRLGVNDRALVIASDGLWDVMSQSDVAQLIGLYLDKEEDVYEQNAATMLIRRAIGEGWDGYDEMEVRRSLAIPQKESRLYRDDITVQVVFF